ncbi:MAG: hypothetical protein COT67_00815 [Candidatus Tagabacteria bacterium CG09_land_8_20_14_0_10_41_14]|uniref:Sugar ABC transporter substrate-binding protein n=2 Tax=Candidatus Tagaibacteriota TaxID=1817918 RepID=A0A2H0WM12_9BACT|nr:MAG: hypothetical protein COT67_00815 [Candidatus Tagabacteria bacterium CG09_land_8_20_14_0_10_41_14]PJE73270.1 MAG: hypothetical protein COV00_00835 [Candidatus Tagabacteria bacterium CG10_big_fil_rev_8_21_14_0_10_40_13]
MSKFQIIIIGVILGLVVLATLVLAGVIPGLPGRQRGQVVDLTMWGIFPREQMAGAVNLLNQNHQGEFRITYIGKDPENYQSQVVNALAAGAGPDIWLITQDMILKDKDKLFQIPFEVFNRRDFMDTFIDQASLFLSQDGFYAVPLVVDPIVLYWNKDLLRSEGLVSPPQNWDEFLNFSQALTKTDKAGNIIQSGAAMGVASNVNYFKDILSLLLFQGGNKIVEEGNRAGEWDVVFGESVTGVTDPTVSALNFYTAFSDPSRVSYSWNRALPSSKKFFTAGKLAMYFGRAGEFKEIEAANPHLNFDVSLVPRLSSSSLYFTFGRLYGLAISKTSTNINAALGAAFAFTGEEELKEIENNTMLLPGRRALLKKQPSDTALAVFYKAAVQSGGWLEPDADSVSNIFADMVESIVTGRKKISTAIRDAKKLLEAEFKSLNH